MSLNWVMLPTPPSPTQPFIPLPNERTLFTSTPRVTLTLQTSKPSSTYPAHTASPAHLSISSSDGTIYLTNQRLLYLPAPRSSITTNTASFNSFSAPLLNLHDTHLVMPWFGPNSWTALVQPVPGGNLVAGQAAVELKITFKDGGAPQFQEMFERVKERLLAVTQLWEQHGTNRSLASGAPPDLSNVHLDQLPSYQEHGQDRVAREEEVRRARGPDDMVMDRDLDAGDVETEPEIEVPTSATAEEVRAMAAVAATRREEESRRRRSREVEEASRTPVEAPPGYEEVQHEIVVDGLARRLERS